MKPRNFWRSFLYYGIPVTIGIGLFSPFLMLQSGIEFQHLWIACPAASLGFGLLYGSLMAAIMHTRAIELPYPTDGQSQASLVASLKKLDYHLEESTQKTLMFKPGRMTGRQAGRLAVHLCGDHIVMQGAAFYVSSLRRRLQRIMRKQVRQAAREPEDR